MLESLFDKVADLMPAILLKETTTRVFLWIFRNFQERLFYRTPPGDCFCKLHHLYKVNDESGIQFGFTNTDDLAWLSFLWRHFPINKLLFWFKLDVEIHKTRNTDSVSFNYFDLNLMLRFSKQEILTQYPLIISNDWSIFQE